MTITPDTVITGVDPYDISEEKFAAVLRAAGSPAADSSHDAYMILGTFPVSIAAMLAVFAHESGYATNPAAIVVTHGTRNPGNCRSSRIGALPIVQTARGPFVAYPSWADGWRDLAWRLVDPTYVYAKEGRRTIRQVIERFAPAMDGNAPDAYVNAVVADMTRWQEAATGDDARFEWRPDTSEYGYPQGTRGRNGQSVDYLIVHVTEGTDSLGWLNGNHGSSAHYLTHRDGTPRAQMVRESDAAWTAGNQDYNERGINIELERFAREDWTDAEYRTAAATCYPLLKRNSIPLAYLGRNNASLRGIIGHEHVPDPAGTGWGGAGNHTDPGLRFDWSRFMAALRALDGAGAPETPPETVMFPETGQTLSGGFRRFWEARGGVAIFGYPITGEQGEDGVTVQWFERARLEHRPDTGKPEDWHVVLGRVGAEVLVMREVVADLREQVAAWTGE